MDLDTLNKKRLFVPGFLAALLTLAVFSTNLNGQFQLDDEGWLLHTPSIQMQRLSANGLTEAFFALDNGTRGFAHATYAVNYWLHGVNVEGWHWVNNTIHAINVILLFFLLIRLLRVFGMPRSQISLSLAFFLTMYWAIHPFQAQTVTYVIQRITLLAGLCYLICFHCWLNWRESKKIKNLVWFAFVFLLGIFCKAIIYNIFFAIILVEFCARDRSLRFFATKSFWRPTALFFLTLPIILYVRGDLSRYFVETSSNIGISIQERLLTQCRVVWRYVDIFFMPLDQKLTLEHYIQPSVGLFEPLTTFAGLVTLALALLFSLTQVKKYPLICFGILFYFSHLLIESSVIPLEMMFEHRMYLPTIGLLIVMYKILSEMWKWFLSRRENDAVMDSDTALPAG